MEPVTEIGGMRFTALFIINSFTADDVKNFKKFLQFNQVNRSEKLQNFFGLINNYFTPDASKEKFSKKLTFKFVCKKYGNNDKKVKKLFKNLGQLCEHYLANYRFENYRYLKKMALIRELHERSIEKPLFKEIKTIQKELNSFKHFSREDFYIRHILEDITNERENFWTIHRQNKFITIKKDAALTINSYLLLFYYIQSIETFINLFDYNDKLQITSTQLPFFKFFEILKTEFDKIIDSEILNSFYKDVIKAYILLSEMIQKIDLFENFKNYKKLLAKIADHLDIDEKYNLFTGYQYIFPEITLIKDDKARKDYQRLELDFIKSYFENQAYKNSGHEYITMNGFKFFYTRSDNSEIESGHRLGDEIVQNHITSLHPDHRTSMAALRNTGVFIEREKDFEKAKIELAKVQLKKIPEPSNIRDYDFFFIKIYYETKEYGEMEIHRKSLKKFLERKNLPHMHQEIFLIFVDFIKRLAKIAEKINFSSNNKIIDLQLLYDEVVKTHQLPSKDWLLEKIREILPKTEPVL